MADTEKTGKVASINYRTDFLFEVKLDSSTDTFIAEDTMNQTAVDLAMMRGVKVVLTIDQSGLIRRVASEPADSSLLSAQSQPGAPQNVPLTRISTQVHGVTGRMFCEVFFKDASGDEKSVQSFDPVIEHLAGSAFLARKPIGLVLDPIDNNRLLGISKSALE